MAVTTIKSTDSLDVKSMRTLEELGSTMEPIEDRSVAARPSMEGDPGNCAILDALDRLQTSLRERKVDFTQWARDLKAERRTAARRLRSQFQ